jgi:hypothetical protein
LLHVAEALGAQGPGFGAAQGWQQQRRQNGNNCDHHQEFNQRKGKPSRIMFLVIHFYFIISISPKLPAARQGFL